MKGKENKIAKSEKDLEKIIKRTKQEEEELELIMKANEIKEETFDFGNDGDVIVKSEIADFILEQIDDPEKKYELYYNVIQRLLKKHLPKGDEYCQARELIYEEKNVFLTGKRKDEKGIRHADSRMSYTPRMSELVGIISNWIVNNGTMFELYDILRKENSQSNGEKE